MLLIIFSCENKDHVATPTVVISEPQMVEIITDVQIMENAINLRRGRSQKIVNLKTTGFNEIFKHYNITDSIFYENLDYYNENPELMKRILDSVSARFEEMHKAIELKKDENKDNDNDKNKKAA